ncbi:2-dehydro-3-deoxygalactonokinase [Parapedobacter koreensis]|uniref:2-dehydro-3-deoxygalactonokinase n=1 Tax=Parapedobacter koreensis TaxID=332977 RepID=A0A1H7TG32_9SPHI|nr:2-dehydro-3-deoxygalactonokinase [Parapedobacter koreensis]SEL83525.1 2-dehydro-3-deoxygalactonokinase [Parapedobacter koreensis]
MERFLSCDWGTSRFRLRLIQATDLHVLASVTHDKGIAETFRLWKEQRGKSIRREEFYANALRDAVDELEQKSGALLNDVPIVISGMASSTIGLMELPYKTLPFQLDGSDLYAEALYTETLNNRLILVSGVRTDRDVMRGEETKVVGCAPLLEHTEKEQLLILPGTHPKHVWIKGNQATAFETYMTGEFFDLLSVQSMLSDSVEAGADFQDPANQACFCEGVDASQTSDLLHAAFMVRTNQLLKQIPKTRNFYYLSGVLIGAELRGICANTPVYLVGAPKHSHLYERALNELGVPIVKIIDADTALISGQRLIFSALRT